MPYRRLLFLSFLLTVPILVFCQRVGVSGTVRSGGELVPYATVVLSNDSTARSVISYAVTDDNGRFTVKPGKAARSCWITVRCIGYDTYKQLREISDGETLDIELAESSIALSGITVKGNAYGVSLKSDTVVYTPSAFTNGSEQSLEDVVKKMPGMTVDQSGSISYQGKKVGKVLVDGKDILAGGNAGAVRTLSPDFATSLELIANYSDGGMEDSFKAQETTALNIKSGGKGKISGTLEGGGGFKEKLDVKSSLLKIKERYSASAMVNANNTGEPVFSILDYINTMGGLENIGASSGGATTISLSSNSWEQRMLLPAENEYERPAGIGNLNVTLEPNANYRLTMGAIYHHSTAKSSSYNREEYSLPEGSFTNDAESKGKQDNDFTSFVANQSWKISGRTSARAYTKVSYGDYSADNEVSNRYSESSINADEDNHAQALNVMQQLSLNTLVGRGLLFGKVDFSMKDTQQDYAALTDADIPTVFATEGNLFQARRDNSDLALNGSVGVVYPIIGKYINLKAEVRGSYSTSKLDIRNALSEDEEDMHAGTFSLYGGLMKNKGIFRFDAGTSLSSYSLNANLHSTDRLEKNIWRLEPTLSAGLYFSQRHKLLFSLAYTLKPTDINALSRAMMLNAYNLIQEASDYDNLLEKNLKAGVSYQYFSLFSRTTLFMYATYSQTNDTYRQDYSSDGIISYVKNTNGGEKRSATASLYLNKGLASIPLDLKATVNYTYTSCNMLRNSVPLEMQNNILNTSAGFTSRFKSFPINFELTGIFNFTDNRISRMDIYTSNKEYGGDLRLIYTMKAFSASLTGKVRKVTNGSSDYQQNDADILLSYKLNKFRLKISGVDIFHLGKKEWLTESVTPNVKSYIQYRRHNGHLICSISYSL